MCYTLPKNYKTDRITMCSQISTCSTETSIYYAAPPSWQLTTRHYSILHIIILFVLLKYILYRQYLYNIVQCWFAYYYMLWRKGAHALNYYLSVISRLNRGNIIFSKGNTERGCSLGAVGSLAGAGRECRERKRRKTKCKMNNWHITTSAPPLTSAARRQICLEMCTHTRNNVFYK